MPYNDLAKLTARFGEDLLLQLADRDGSGAVDAGVVDGAIADTDAVIDGYLAGRYKLPLASTPPMLADLAAAITIYKLQRKGAPGLDITVEEESPAAGGR